MKHYQVIIIGAGPAGSACARKLVENGVDCLVLDKVDFPRQKTCAGWVTPQVFNDLGVDPGDYPFELTEYPFLKIYLNKFAISLPGTQYAIRRIEFDDWMLRRCGADFNRHHVKRIWTTDQGYCVDGHYAAEYLIGAGGTYCPVNRTYFRELNPWRGTRIIALEEEFKVPLNDPVCRLWFFRNKLPGYSWFVPKTNGWLNIGIGGNAAALKEHGATIQEHWDAFLSDLKENGLVPDRSFKPRGYVYHLQSLEKVVKKDKIFLVGDSAGLATLDMGEGIGPAIQSGMKAAAAIVDKSPFSLEGISPFSLLPKGLRWMIRSK
jgi:flavin-dependent dehydrogenase